MLRFIDANCMIGPKMKPVQGVPDTAEELCRVMDRCGIDKAIVCYSVAKDGDITIGNKLLHGAISGKDRLMPQWIVMPNSFREFYSPAELLSQMKKHNVKTVRMYPQLTGFSLQPYAIGGLMDAFAQCRIPVMMDMAQVSHDEIYTFCKNYPEVKLIICYPGYRNGRTFDALLHACPNLYIDSSNFCAHNGVADVCRSFGAKRMVFGSGIPAGSAASAVSLIRYADISEEEKQLIASGNILSMLEEVRL